MTTMDIFSLVLMGAASALCIALIFLVARVTKTIANLDTGLKTIIEEVKPITASVTNLTIKLNDITEELKTPLNASINVFLQLKERVDLVLDVEENLRETIITNVTAVVNAIKSFADVYKGNGHVPKRTIFRS